MQGFGQSASRKRFETKHRVVSGGLNPSLEEPRPRQHYGPSYILNGDKIYSHEGVIARAKAMGSLVVQFVPKHGRPQEAATCDTLLAVAAAIPQKFEGGHATIRASQPYMAEYPLNRRTVLRRA